VLIVRFCRCSSREQKIQTASIISRHSLCITGGTVKGRKWWKGKKEASRESIKKGKINSEWQNLIWVKSTVKIQKLKSQGKRSYFAKGKVDR